MLVAILCGPNYPRREKGRFLPVRFLQANRVDLVIFLGTRSVINVLRVGRSICETCFYFEGRSRVSFSCAVFMFSNEGGARFCDALWDVRGRPTTKDFLPVAKLIAFVCRLVP